MQTSASLDPNSLERMRASLIELARQASIEMNVHDHRHIEEAHRRLGSSRRIFISHLPRQHWAEGIEMCRAVRNIGYEPIPHIPARLLPDERFLESLLAQLADVGTREALIIAGDYPHAAGPFHTTSDVLRTGALRRYGFERVCIAGHPEGHPKVPAAELQSAELQRVELAAQLGLEVRFVTQFFFEAAPFLQWLARLRAANVRVPVIAGLAGPAGLATLFKFALRCGVGPSIRALGARPSAFTKLLGEHGPESVLADLLQAHHDYAADFSGIHLFAFGGFLRTCSWVQAVSDGRFNLRNGQFEVLSR